MTDAPCCFVKGALSQRRGREYVGHGDASARLALPEVGGSPWLSGLAAPVANRFRPTGKRKAPVSRDKGANTLIVVKTVVNVKHRSSRRAPLLPR